jgi:hypothetical protein
MTAETPAVAADLVKDLRRQVSALEDDLRVRSDEVPESASALRAEYAKAKAANRTAATYESWRDERVTQVAAAWVLGTVFVRYCEDNGLIAWPFIAGPGERLTDAEERHEAYFREHPDHNDRDWIVAAFDHLAAAHPTVAGLFDRKHNPLWEIPPSFETATALLQFWRRRGDDGEIRYDFTGWDTRFLGDLYQDLSEHARKTYALLQTPVFVEEFILDLTLKPAIKEFGLIGLRTIDPACGSGHFLLGIFRYLLARWRAAESGTGLWELIRRSLESVHGCDKNPFAASIARFRLLVAVLRSAEIERLDSAPDFPINIAVGDSLIHGRGVNWEQIELDLPGGRKRHAYRVEDVKEFVKSCDLLGLHSYHVVVGNPPYITVKDRQENKNYRHVYKEVCGGKYALSVPFVQRLFDLATRTGHNDRAAGFVGQITANSFMKREFGRKLIEEFLPAVLLTHIVDTSGAYIPGHGTPTVILIGRCQGGRRDDLIRTVMGIRGEPQEPRDPERGLVWSAIVRQIGTPGSTSDWVSVSDVPRSGFFAFPWSLSGGGAAELSGSILAAANVTLSDRIDGNIGPASFAGLDDPYFLPSAWHRRFRIRSPLSRPLATGENVRDWRLDTAAIALAPYYDDSRLVPFDAQSSWGRHLWRFRRMLQSLVGFGGVAKIESGEPWWSWYRWIPERYRAKLLLTFASVSTHPHFALNRSLRAFNRHAPVVKLSEGASEEDRLALLGILNSSSACFWLKQVCHNKGNGGVNEGYRGDDWEEFYEFTGTKLQEYPLPSDLPLSYGRLLDSLAQRLATHEPSAVCARAISSRARLDAAHLEYEHVRRQMIAMQEELDWTVYHLYGLLTETERARLTSPDQHDVPEINFGERAFEIVLARKIAAGKVETAWFARHGSAPITELPGDWPAWYQRVVQARIDTIEKRRDIALIERPECKRRWATQPWEKKEAEALRTWLLDRCERRDYWFGLRDGFEQPRTLTVNQLADRFRDDQDMHSVAELYATSHLGKPDLTLAQVLDRIIADQHVPYLAALRYKDTGLRKRMQWEQVWEQQREEDRTGQRLDIPVPPKYTSADFRKNSYWAQRGKLDVPKERFISYPAANPDSDPTLLLGWAGWNHADQAQALVNLINDRAADAGWDTARLIPLLAGLAEVMPWVHQWHNKYDEDWGGNPAEEYQTYLDEQRTRHQLTETDLTNWRPAPAKRGRKNGQAQ